MPGGGGYSLCDGWYICAAVLTPFFHFGRIEHDLFGVFFLIHQHKNDLLSTNPRKIRSFWPQNTIFPSIFLGPIFSGPRHTPSNFRTEYPPPGSYVSYPTDYPTATLWGLWSSLLYRVSTMALFAEASLRMIRAKELPYYYTNSVWLQPHHGPLTNFFFLQQSLKTLHSSPMRGRYWMYLKSSKSDQICALCCIIHCYSEQHHNGMWQH